LQCGKIFEVQRYRKNTAKYCSRSCLAKAHLAQFRPTYGFKKSKEPPHRYKTITVNGKQMRRYRWVMEQHLGRKLTRDEHVHHVNGNSRDDRIENLQVLSNSEHQKIELRNRL
jgi:hypothetical protein